MLSECGVIKIVFYNTLFDQPTDYALKYLLIYNFLLE